MSSVDLLVELDEAIPVSTRLELSMDWPGLYYGKDMVRLTMIASVTHVNSQGTHLRLNSHKFRDTVPAKNTQTTKSHRPCLSPLVRYPGITDARDVPNRSAVGGPALR